MKDALIVALDAPTLKQASRLVDKLYPTVKIFKIGKELFTAAGPGAIEMVHKKRAKVFLDLKFHDIPNTVAKAINAAKKMNVFMANVHISGGSNMIRAAVKARGNIKKPILLGVTVLTSMDKQQLQQVGITRSPLQQVLHLALLGESAGLDGVVCSAEEAPAIRQCCGKHFLIVTPGIRPVNTDSGDQRRVVTPEKAVQLGADFIVVGRPITQAKDPLKTAKAIVTALS